MMVTKCLPKDFTGTLLNVKTSWSVKRWVFLSFTVDTIIVMLALLKKNMTCMSKSVSSNKSSKNKWDLIIRKKLMKVCKLRSKIRGFSKNIEMTKPLTNWEITISKKKTRVMTQMTFLLRTSDMKITKGISHSLNRTKKLQELSLDKNLFRPIQAVVNLKRANLALCMTHRFHLLKTSLNFQIWSH